MRKFLISIAILVLSVIMILFSTGCSFVGEIYNPNNTSGNTTGGGIGNTTESTGGNVNDFGDTAEGNVIVKNVSFKTLNAPDRTLMTYEQAVEKVKMTSVAIYTDTGSGSGVVIDMSVEGVTDENIVYVITCHHMVSGKGNITVSLPDENYQYNNNDYVFTGVVGGKPSENTGYAVTLIGGDFSSDIALLKLNLNIAAKSGNKLPVSKVVKACVPAEGYSISLAESVFSVGNPTGELPGTVSVGNVAYLERTTAIEDIGSMNLLQIGVPTNPGNSGGGLYNLYGELIGITNAGNTNYSLINFAIPFELSEDYAENRTITNYGYKYVVRDLLATAWENNYGCVVGSKKQFGFSITQGTNSDLSTYVYVTSVTNGGIAYKSGLRVGDIIESVSVNGGAIVSVKTVSDFSSVFSNLKVGDVVRINGYNITTYRGQSRKNSFSYEMKASQFWFCNTEEYQNP